MQDAFAGKDYTILVHNSIQTLNTSVQKVIILHELLHLSIYLELIGESSQTIGNVLPDFNQYFNMHQGDFNEASHEYFAENYLNNIAEIISEIAPDLNADKAKWGSLTGTEAFGNLTPTQQEDIQNYLSSNNL